jgi:hypothetical protein
VAFAGVPGPVADDATPSTQVGEGRANGEQQTAGRDKSRPYDGGGDSARRPAGAEPLSANL